MNDREAEAIDKLAEELDVAGQLIDDATSGVIADRWADLVAERLIERIDQAGRRLPEALADKYFGTAGASALRGMRNRLAHEYDKTDYEILWDAVRHDLPGVRSRMESDVSEARKMLSAAVLDLAAADEAAWQAASTSAVEEEA
ncbi:MAG: DUF86 domain-containing protein [Bifidobacteriaceae bacterium]|nr:DUF86 domain-containing protein [Bifidobacteriaceae bacterium]